MVDASVVVRIQEGDQSGITDYAEALMKNKNWNLNKKDNAILINNPSIMAN